MNNELSEFTLEKNDGACDTYTAEELKNITHTSKILCPKCGITAIWREDNTYICPECKHIFVTEKFILE